MSVHQTGSNRKKLQGWLGKKTEASSAAQSAVASTSTVKSPSASASTVVGSRGATRPVSEWIGKGSPESAIYVRGTFNESLGTARGRREWVPWDVEFKSDIEVPPFDQCNATQRAVVSEVYGLAASLGSALSKLDDKAGNTDGWSEAKIATQRRKTHEATRSVVKKLNKKSNLSIVAVDDQQWFYLDSNIPKIDLAQLPSHDPGNSELETKVIKTLTLADVEWAQRKERK